MWHSNKTSCCSHKRFYRTFLVNILGVLGKSSRDNMKSNKTSCSILEYIIWSTIQNKMKGWKGKKKYERVESAWEKEEKKRIIEGREYPMIVYKMSVSLNKGTYSDAHGCYQLGPRASHMATTSHVRTLFLLPANFMCLR